MVYSREMTSSLGEEGQIIRCRQCGAPMEGGIIQSDGTIRFVCTENFEHILYVQQNN